MEDLVYENAAGTFIVSHRKALSHHMPVSHFHSTYEIYCLLSGMREFFIRDRTITLSEGDVVIIAPNVLHRTTNAQKPKHERLIINVHEGMLSPDGSHKEALQLLLERDFLLIRGSLRARMAIEPLSRAILQEVQEQGNGFGLFVQTLAVQLLITCCRQMKQNDMGLLEASSPMHERISEIVRHINTHYMEELSLHVLADKFYISPYYLSRSFKEATGFVFVEYVNSVRVKEAKKLLEHSSMKVNQIARKVGFGSVTHFGRVFKMVTGQVPLYYRKSH
ncbi:AraC family transcriptional regulator [Paenibacillus agaridevorans]|uniref:AraC family transcriptional regulator n=1 Tax=Paenibacillus agaridevorans TaxID=171404 RepID=UPI001BE48796|nr:AraC family transcriptional regulator [Paenibacillus agaridevorans]